MTSLQSAKYNPVIVSIYNKILDYQCQNVQAYVFVATTGRSGTESLSRIFKAVEGSACFHEPYPIMFNDYSPHTDIEQYFHDLFYKIKRINIKRASIGKTCYIETNHQFVKNFVSQAIACFRSKIRIVHLSRDPVRVATSLYAIDSIPGKTKRGKYYLSDPDDANNLIKMPELYNGNKEFEHDIYRCLWYWYEVEARIKKIKIKNQHILWHSIKTEDLNKMKSMADMFRNFGLPFNTSRLKSIIGIRSNKKSLEKVNKVEIGECEVMNERLLHLLNKRYGPHL